MGRLVMFDVFFFFSSRRRHTRLTCDWSSDVCSSDLAHVSQLCDACMSTDLLGQWVRDRGVLPLEAGVRKLTGEPADVYDLRDRGYVREGMTADLTVFDPDTVAPGPLRRVRDFPADGERLVADAPVGMAHVIVNGTPIRVDGEPVPDAVDGRPRSGPVNVNAGRLRSGPKGGSRRTFPSRRTPRAAPRWAADRRASS